MSTQSGKNKGRAGKGSGDSASGTSRAGGKSGKKTVAASAAKPGRDEATVEISQAEETKTDMPRIDPDAEPAESAAEPDAQITPVKDTTDPESAGSSESPASPASSEPGWTKPAEPAESVSTGRTEQNSSPSTPGSPGPGPWNLNTPGPGSRGPGSPGPSFVGPTSAGPSAPAQGEHAPSGNSGGAGRSCFARAVLKNRPAKAPSSTSGKSARRAQLQLARLEPWSVMKFSFVMSLVCFVVLLVAVVVLYAILSGLGVFTAISDTLSDVTRQPGETEGGLDAGSWFSFFRVFGYTVLVGALNVLLITALSTVGSVIYNLAADLVGGIEVTLKEAD